MTKHPKRPRDPNQWHKLIVDIAMGVAGDKQPSPEEQGKDPCALARGRAGGLERGKARAEKLSAEEREQLDTLIHAGKRPAQQLTKARILLKADVSEAGEGWRDIRDRYNRGRLSRANPHNSSL